MVRRASKQLPTGKGKKLLAQLLGQLAKRLDALEEREGYSTDQAMAALGMTRANYFAYKRGLPRNQKGWNLVDLVQLATLEGRSLSSLFMDLEGHKPDLQLMSKTDEDLLGRLRAAPLSERKALGDALAGDFPKALGNKARWVVTLVLDLLRLNTETELMDIERSQHQKAIGLPGSALEKAGRRERIIDLMRLLIQENDEAPKPKVGKKPLR